MVSLMSPPTRSARDLADDLRHRRPLVLVATIAGAAAAAVTLLICCAAGVVGWFLTNNGEYGAPHDALRVAALAWLAGHGSGVHVQGAALTAVPLGLTLLFAWTIWRAGLKVGESISGHGPDADRIADGARDWTVPAAAGLFTLAYVVAVIVTASVAGTPATAPDVSGAAIFSAVMCLVIGGPGIAIASGRAAVWVGLVPEWLRDGLAVARAMVTGVLLVSFVAFAVSLALNLSTAANVLSQMHASGSTTFLYVALAVLLAPNATLFSSAYLLGPGFAVGAGTLVAPASVVAGPLPMFPLLAAMPQQSHSWTPWLELLVPLVAVVAVVRLQRHKPALGWDEGAIRGAIGGVVAGVVLGFLAGLSGGAVGPGRMIDVGPHALDVTWHAVTYLGLAGALAGLALTWWQRRTMLD